MAQESNEETQSNNKLPKGRGGQVIIIEDKEEDRLTLRTMLETCGYTVKEIDDARRTTGFFGSRPDGWKPAAVFVDLILSGSSGYEVIRNIRERYDKIPLVVVSTMAAPEDIFEAQNAGAHGFVVKPYTPQGIVETINYIADNLRKPIGEKKGGIFVKRPD